MSLCVLVMQHSGFHLRLLSPKPEAMQNLGMKWLCGLMLLWGSHLFGQSAYHDDLITLKNGSVLRGHIISQSTDEGLMM